MPEITLATGGSLSQGYDRAGNVLTESRALTGISGNAGSSTQYFSYDGLNRVVQANLGSSGTPCGQAGATCYAYDRDGNRVTKQVGSTTTSYVYAATDQLVSQTIGATTKTFTYDAYGNLTQSADAASAYTSYTYDLADRRISLTPSAGSAATYGLDALGRTLSRTVGAVTDSYSFVGSSETVWQIANGTTTTTAAIDAGGSRTAVSVGATTNYVLFDLHGSLVGAENPSKVITEAYRYDAYGELVASVPTTPSLAWRYQGQLDLSPDLANPVYENGARDYSPGLGTFLSLDTWSGSAIDPRSMNRFLYAEANPTTLVDPSGHASYQAGQVCPYGPDDCGSVGWSPKNYSTGRTVTDSDVERVFETSNGAQSATAGGATVVRSPPQTFDRRPLCSIERLSCTTADFNRMSLSERKAWIRALMDVYGKEGQFSDWFNNVIGILDFASDQGIMNRDSWESWVDSSILQGITDGLALRRGGIESSTNPGAYAWASFFKQRFESGDADLNASMALWGIAEQTSTNHGVAFAERVGLSGDPRVVKTLITFGNAYRAGVKSPVLRERLGREVGAAFGQLISGLPNCAMCQYADEAGGTVGALYAPAVVDPRTSFWSYWLSTMLYTWNP